MVIDKPVQLVAIFMPHESSPTAQSAEKHHQDDVSRKLLSLDAVLVVVDHTTADPGSMFPVAEQVDRVAVLQVRFLEATVGSFVPRCPCL